MKRNHTFGSIAAAALVALLAAPLAHGVGTGGTGLRVYAHGALYRNGGVVVKGITFDPSQATVTINGEPHSADDLLPGMVAGVDGNVVPGLSTGTANSIQATRVVLGAVNDIAPAAIMRVGTGGTGLRIRVAGISVNPRSDVVVAGCASLADIVVGTTLDVYGYSDGILGSVDATRIECVDPSNTVELHGVASAITPASIAPASIVVQGVTVNTSSATFVGFDVPIAAGDRVEVDGTTDGQSILWTTVTFEPDADTSNGEDAEVEDAISAMMGPAVFVVDDFTIDATNAHFSNGTAADLAVGRVVHVEGTVVNGILNAKSVEFDDGESGDGGGTSNPPAGTELDDVDGAISAFISAASFVVHGITIDASAATFVNGAATDLADGKVVKMIGARTGLAMKATTVTFETGDTGDTELEDVDGAITAFTSTANFTVDGISVDASTATFVNGVAADLAIGKSVKILGTLTGTAMQATQVTFISGSGSDDGTDGGGGGGHSGGGPGSGGGTNPGTTKPPSGGDGGDDHPGGGDGSSAASAEVEGPVGSLVSPGIFTVGTVTVDAKSARISGGSVADIREGTRVHATGPIQAGTLVATRVEIDD